MSSINRVPLSALPLPPSSHVITRNLTPDPHTPSPPELRKVQGERPSIQRRARLLSPQSHFSYVVPYPVPFPFRIAPEEGEEVADQAAFIENWLAQRESVNGMVHEVDIENGEAKADVSDVKANGTRLKKYYPKNRDQPLELIGLSETGLRDCLPHLHVGDAFDVLGTPTLSRASEEAPARTEPSEEDVAARQELLDVLSGHAALMNVDGEKGDAWAPWSLRYSGHQFGVWAGQLGDGRAISVCE